ncbi:septum formation initiator family protein [Ureibacillus sp. Re31]|uniref:Septum formation initiator family protein n=1 Tax=Ureibacillus galli TaxID=2762222 RepID=A0ABR8XH60_9BACL|nr:septum formation initiator family protein [Ureibacillus galli]MBD8028551.1 septum formation initiator family protein [Ureibacillus galli]
MVKRNNRQQKNVRTLENDYVRSSDSKAQYKKRQKILFRRRIFVFGLLATVTLVLLVSSYITQNNRLEEKQKQKDEIVAKLDSVKEQQDTLKLQIAKLEDDEYIAKLARKEYFLSDDGEIIFTIPDEDESDNEKAKENDK